MKGLAAAFLLVGGSLFAQPAASLVEVRASVSPATVAPGGTFSLVVTANLRAGWHVNAHQPSEDYLIATNVSLEPLAGITFAGIRYPAAKQAKFSFADKPLAVYEGTITVTGQGSAASSSAAGPREIAGTFSYQPCNDKQRLAPARVPFRTSIAVASAALKGAGAASASEPAHPGARDTAPRAAVRTSRPFFRRGGSFCSSRFSFSAGSHSTSRRASTRSSRSRSDSSAGSRRENRDGPSVSRRPTSSGWR